MALGVGTRLGAYEITGVLGAGGMGEVYRATDTNLKRQVAIKILPPAFASDAERIARFQREAEVLASLNHSNIAHVYGLERSGGATALAMELVEGPTLAERIAQGPIPPQEALDIATQIADALEAAHNGGIVHRDLKPANIKLSPDGTVKVLDFGIAKALQIRRGASGDPQTPLLTTPAMTQAGNLLGTATYMSPEQARGKAVDERADIWAFGCVLYEMLTGQPAFGGEDVTTTLARVLERDAAMNALPGGISPAVCQAINLCFRKDVRERIADIRDVKLALQGAFETSPELRPTRAIWMRAVAAMLMLVAVAGATAVYVASRRQEAPLMRLSMALPGGWSLATSSNLGEPTPLVVSPDGRRVAIVVRRAQGPTTIMMRELDSASARPLSGTEGATSLFWSPDSRRLGFFADGKIKTVNASGGAAAVVCDAASPFLGGTWGRDDTIVFSMLDKGNFRLWKVAAGGGQPTYALPDSVASAGSKRNETRPWFLPDGRTLLYVGGATKDGLEVYAAKLDSPDRVKVTEAGSSNVQYAQGHLLFLRGATLVAQPFDQKRLAVTGDPVPIVDRVSRQGAIPGYGLFSASQNGVLAYYAGTEAGTATRLAWVDRRGQTLETIGESSDYQGVALSHDETRVAAVVGAPSDLFVINVSNGVSTQFTFDAKADFPIWSSDDRFIDFDAPSKSNGLPSANRKPSNGAGASERILPDDKDINLPFDLSPDGSLLYVTRGKGRAADLWVLPSTGDRTPFRLAATPDDKRLAKFSPNGRWVAYVSYDASASGQSVWVVPFLGRAGAGSVKWRVSGAEGGSVPLWSADGHELFYVSSSKMLMDVQVDGDGQAFQVGPSKALFPISVAQLEGGYAGWPYAVSKDGQRFLVLLSAEKGAAMESVGIEINWTARPGQ